MALRWSRAASELPGIPPHIQQFAAHREAQACALAMINQCSDKPGGDPAVVEARSTSRIRKKVHSAVRWANVRS